MAVLERRMQTAEIEIVSLRDDRHRHAEIIHEHGIRLDYLEKKQ